MSSDEDVPKQTPYMQQHNAVVHSVAVIPDIMCRSIVYGFADGTIQLSRADGRTRKVDADGPVWVIAVSNDSKYIVSGGEDGRITIWDSNLDVQQNIRSTSSREKITALNASPDSAMVASGSNDGEVTVWDITSGKCLVGPLAAHSRQVRCVQFSPQGNRIATVANSEPSLRIWNSLTGDLLVDVTISNPHALVWLSDEQILAASEKHTRCLDTSTGSTVATCPGGMTQLAITHGRTMVVGLNKRDVYFWHTDTLNWSTPIIKHDYKPCSIALFFYVLVVGGDGQSSVWNLTDPDLFVDPIQGLIDNSDPVMCERVLTEMIALGELQLPSDISTMYFTRAIVRSRMEKWADALHDAEMAIKAKHSIEGYIAKSTILCYQGNYEYAMQVSDLAFHHAGPEDMSFLLLVKAVLVFLAGLRNPAVSRVEDLMQLEPDEPLHHLVLGQMLVLLAAAAVDDGDYDHAVELLIRAGDPGPFREDSRWQDLTMITGWKLGRVRTTVHRQKCEVLLAAGHPKDATDSLHTMMDTLEKDMTSTDEIEWVADFRARCIKALEQRGGVAMGSASYEDAVVHYTTALSLDPLSTDLLVKRSKARAGVGSWDESLEDADAAIKLDPSSPNGHERKHTALLGAKRYDEAIDAYNNMLLNLEQSPDPVTRDLRKNYVSPSQTEVAIRNAVKRTQRDAPLVLIDTETGRLCDEHERMDGFEADPKFKELVASMTTKLDNPRIRQVVQEYFRYATFSHTWEGAEPLFHDVLHGSVDKLAASPTVLKLVMFCTTVREAGLRWAWCDTCCINKTDGSVLQESLTSMFQWYHKSSLTIVHLRGVRSDSELGALERSPWNTRAWTLQEFFASRVIRFYTEDWKPYIPLSRVYNHKDSSEIMGEMARANGVDSQVLLSLRPGSENVRQKLCLAATRTATKQEDMAYSLFGIFDVSIPVTYGEGQQRALGRLLQEVLTRSGDVTILAWTGKASDYNSCLPADISVYREPVSPYVPSSIGHGEMDALVAELRTSSGHLDSAMMLYDRVVLLPSPRLVSRRLSLSCIMFPLRGRLVPNGDSAQPIYRTVTSAFGNVEIKTTEDLSSLNNLVLVHPWLQCLLDPALPFEDLIVDDDDEPLTPLDGDGRNGDSDALSTDAYSPSSPHTTSASALHHSSQPDKLTRSLRLFVRLRQPFGALLLVPLSYNEYKRVSSDQPIVVQLLEDVSPRYLAQKIRTLDIL